MLFFVSFLIAISLSSYGKASLVPAQLHSCNSMNCMNGANCEYVDGKLGCGCPPQFTGEKCQFVNPCFDSPCKNSGRCENLEDSAICICRRGYEGMFCEISVQGNVIRPDLEQSEKIKGLDNICEKLEYFDGTTPCLNSGLCVSTQSSYECKCRAGFSGDKCQFEDPCASFSCKNGGSCESFDDSAVCNCPPMFTGRFCEETIAADPNSSSSSIVSPESNGILETAIEIFLNPCIASNCLNGGTCNPLPKGHFECECQENYLGAFCQFLNPCLSSPCLNGGACEPYEDSGTCNCPAGFKGRICEEIDAGKSLKGRLAGLRSLIGRKIDAGWTRKKKEKISRNEGKRDHCHNAEEEAEVCLNGGKCVILDELTYGCECPIAYTGRFCEHVNPCINSPCLNGGTCEAFQAAGVCLCPEDYTGTICEIWIKEDEVDQGDRSKEVLWEEGGGDNIEEQLESKLISKILSHNYRSKIQPPTRSSHPSRPEQREQNDASNRFSPNQAVDASIVKIMPNGEMYLKMRIPKRSRKSKHKNGDKNVDRFGSIE